MVDLSELSEDEESNMTEETVEKVRQLRNSMSQEVEEMHIGHGFYGETVACLDDEGVVAEIRCNDEQNYSLYERGKDGLDETEKYIGDLEEALDFLSNTKYFN